MLGFRRIVTLTALAALPVISMAAGLESETGDRPRTEFDPPLPAFPKDVDLKAFYVSPTTDNRFYIDRKSVSVVDDGVVRYTLVVVSSSGSRNVSFEGMRCESGEIRRYAFGRADGTWSKSRNARWEPIEGGAVRNRHHAALFGEYFCPAGGIVGTAAEAIRALDR